MLLDNTLRLRYLQAMGIDVWIPRLTDIELVAQHSSDVEPVILEQSQAFATLDWDALSHIAHSANLCTVAGDCQRHWLGCGNQQADWFLVMDAWPVAGNRTQEAEWLLTDLLAAIGLSREQVFIVTVLNCPQTRAGTSEHDAPSSGWFFLQRQLALVQPKILLLLGELAAQQVLQTNTALSALRGRQHSVAGIPTAVSYHPVHLLDSALDKRLAWQDLQWAMRTYNHKVPGV